MAAEPKPRIMSWRTRIAFAVVLGTITMLAVAWFAALFAVEEWLGLGARAQGTVVLRQAGTDRLWQVDIQADYSPIASYAIVSFWPAQSGDAESYPVIG